mmetsp:Transcript_34023/g.86047  ORF Transcript_34023/g.86047 Transcript_34023/m.86047 type:complete len:232 (+) Transcript_34023:2255-2950(+)
MAKSGSHLRRRWWTNQKAKAAGKGKAKFGAAARMEREASCTRSSSSSSKSRSSTSSSTTRTGAAAVARATTTRGGIAVGTRQSGTRTVGAVTIGTSMVGRKQPPAPRISCTERPSGQCCGAGKRLLVCVLTDMDGRSKPRPSTCEVGITVYDPGFSVPWAADPAEAGRTRNGFARINAGVVLVSLRDHTLARTFLHRWAQATAWLHSRGNVRARDLRTQRPGGALVGAATP